MAEEGMKGPSGEELKKYPTCFKHEFVVTEWLIFHAKLPEGKTLPNNLVATQMVCTNCNMVKVLKREK